MARKSDPADTDTRHPHGRITLPRRGTSPVRMDARLLDEVRLSSAHADGEMQLRLWQGRGKLAVEVVVTGPQGAMLDAATAPGIDGIGGWLEALDPWAGTTPVPAAGSDIAAALWADAVMNQQRNDFRWLVGEALYRWQGMHAGVAAGLEMAS
ncbi:MAG: hypothetical protein MUF73_02830 [Rhodobacteraceae bacterium]|nr:hypothetical protein [Paracoccaceae bacterium]